MTFNQRATSLLQLPVSPLTWDSILKGCDRLEAEFLHIPSGYKWTLDYKRFQVEQARGNNGAAIAYLKSAIATMPYNSDIQGDYKTLVAKSSGIKNLVMIISSKRTEANALRLAQQFDNANVEYMIVSGSDTASINHVRALQVGAPDNYESMSKKVVAALTWVYEHIGNNVGVLKVSDEMSLQSGHRLQESLDHLLKIDAYVGVVESNVEHDRCQHWGKCQDQSLNRKVYGRPFLRPWADGRAYYVGPEPLEKLVLAFTRFPGLFEGEYYEEKLIGDTLVFEGTELKSITGFDEFGLAVGVPKGQGFLRV